MTAVNHWRTAVETHAANHPGARHVCENLDGIDARKVTGGALDLLWASPECTHHSTARGGKPMHDQSRSTAWHVLRWADACRPTWVIVENVPEFATWGPLGATGRPLASRQGETFGAWATALRSLGYTVEWRVCNAADYGAATTRRRLFVVARLDGGARNRGGIPWPVQTHAPADTGSLFGDHARWSRSLRHGAQRVGYWKSEQGFSGDELSTIGRQDLSWLLATLKWCPREVMRGFMEVALSRGYTRNLKWVGACVRNWRAENGLDPQEVL